MFCQNRLKKPAAVCTMSEAPKVCVKVFLTRVLSSKLIKHCDPKKPPENSK